MFFRLLVCLSFLFAFDANCFKFLNKFERGLQKADRFITEFNYAIGATPNLHHQTQSTFQQQHIDSYLDYTPEYHGNYMTLDHADETKFCLNSNYYFMLK